MEKLPIGSEDDVAEIIKPMSVLAFHSVMMKGERMNQ